MFATTFMEGVFASALVYMHCMMLQFEMLLQNGVFGFLKWRQQKNQIVLDLVCYAWFINPTQNTKMKCYLIPYYSDDVNNNHL